MSSELNVLDEILKRVTRIEKTLATLVAQRPASDADLDGRYGDPEIRFTPRGWRGSNFVGRKMSDCPAAFLDLYAAAKDWQAERDEEEGKTSASGKPTAPYARKDAALARGWAKRKRERGEAEPPPQDPGDDWASPPDTTPPEDDIPF